AVGDARVQQDFLETRQVLESFVGSADIGLADDFDQRSAAAVQVNVAAGRGIGKAFVDAFAGVFFHVQARDADALCSAACRGHFDPSVLGQRLVVLGNLIALGQVGVEVILAGEDGARADFAIQSERGQRCELNRFL